MTEITFTFQYGQIMNIEAKRTKAASILIYIPIWLDYESFNSVCLLTRQFTFTFQYGQIMNVKIDEGNDGQI